MPSHERRLWRGEVVTVTEWPRLGTVCWIRDSYGFAQKVRKRDTAKLRTDDERRTFTD